MRSLEEEEIPIDCLVGFCFTLVFFHFQLPCSFTSMSASVFFISHFCLLYLDDGLVCLRVTTVSYMALILERFLCQNAV